MMKYQSQRAKQTQFTSSPQIKQTVEPNHILVSQHHKIIIPNFIQKSRLFQNMVQKKIKSKVSSNKKYNDLDKPSLKLISLQPRTNSKINKTKRKRQYFKQASIRKQPIYINPSTNIRYRLPNQHQNPVQINQSDKQQYRILMSNNPKYKNKNPEIKNMRIQNNCKHQNKTLNANCVLESMECSELDGSIYHFNDPPKHTREEYSLKLLFQSKDNDSEDKRHIYQILKNSSPMTIKSKELTANKPKKKFIFNNQKLMNFFQLSKIGNTESINKNYRKSISKDINRSQFNSSVNKKQRLSLINLRNRTDQISAWEYPTED